MEIMNRNDLDMLVGLVTDEPPATRSAVMSALLRGETPQMGMAQNFSPLPFEAPQAPEPQSMQPPQPRRALPQAMANYTPPPQQPQLPQPRPNLPGSPALPGAQMDYDSQLEALNQQHAAAMQGLEGALQPVDASEMVEAQQRRRQSQSANTLLGIAAQEAGMGSTLGKHYTGLAESDAAPIKYNGGTLTAQGWIPDPGHNAALKVRSAEARVAAIERARNDLVTLKSKQDLEREKLQSQAELRNAQLELQRTIAENNAALRRELANRGGAADAKAAQETARSVSDSRAALKSISDAKALLPESTGSGIGSAVDAAGRWVGYSTSGAQAAAKLKVIAGQLTGYVPKFSGPQSDRDVALYKEMAGRVGDETLPVEERMAALEQVNRLHRRNIEDHGGGAPSGATGDWGGNAPAAPAGGARPSTDDLVKKYAR